MLGSSLSQAWPPFVLVAALLVIGAVGHRDGLFDRLGALLEALPGRSWVLFAASCVLLALTTALLNLDTAVVFVTPVIVNAARRRGIPQAGFIYAALFMVNASSLFLPGSNLTNLLVLAEQHHESSFAGGMLAPGLAASLVTAIGLAIAHRSGLAAGAARSGARASATGRLVGIGSAGALTAAVLMVLFRNPALPVAATAAIVAGVAVAGGVGEHDGAADTAGVAAGAPGVAADDQDTAPTRGVSVRELIRAASPQVLAGIFALAVGLGVLARAWGGPQHLLAHADRPETTAIAAVASVIVNNLPAAVMLSAHAVPHPRALLFGLNLGPNLAVTGSLAAFLWMRTAAQLGAETSVARVSRLGIVLAPLAMAAALLVSVG